MVENNHSGFIRADDAWVGVHSERDWAWHQAGRVESDFEGGGVSMFRLRFVDGSMNRRWWLVVGGWWLVAENLRKSTKIYENL